MPSIKCVLSAELFNALHSSPIHAMQLSQVNLLFGCELPEPELDPGAFQSALYDVAGGIPSVYDPLSGRIRTWIDPEALLERCGVRRRSSCALM